MCKRTEFPGKGLGGNRRDHLFRASSLVTRGLFEVEEEEDKGEYNEEIIRQCAKPMPNPYFHTDDFLEAFENQCNQVSRYFPLCCEQKSTFSLRNLVSSN